MTSDEKIAELKWRLADLAKQLDERARLYRLLNAPEISEEFGRLLSAEVEPMLVIVGAR